MEAKAMLDRLAEARIARLATVGAGGKPHIVPITYALDGASRIFFAVDSKPKRTIHLQRLRNIADNPAVAVLVDGYDEDWTRLWWVRVDGDASVLGPGAEADRAVDLLVSRYAQYRTSRPSGPVVSISVRSITGWSAADNPTR